MAGGLKQAAVLKRGAVHDLLVYKKDADFPGAPLYREYCHQQHPAQGPMAA